ncbi:LemA family protein [Ectothiorhodospira marina]|uniref:LemA protein n=1 Tax=Ectothiorhodospira marina TaxID=1396821 RepID=A0A1H7Q849_9GAMM|nr:LemA family protein [Ectothiorhodospira marina]SEL43969.1 LemA protein [Ectothiorhodospira marina]
MDIGGYVMLGIFFLIALYSVLIYNNLVNLKHAVSKSWSNIEVLLKQRYDELPKLVEVCRQYMAYEKETLERVMRARSAVNAAQQQGDMKSLGEAEDGLRIGLGNLFAVAEAYPDLKADESYRHLQTRISGLENAIADRREYYNESVNRNNVRIEQFPDLVIAHLFRFGPFDLLEFTRRETQDVDVRALFN